MNKLTLLALLTPLIITPGLHGAPASADAMDQKSRAAEQAQSAPATASSATAAAPAPTQFAPDMGHIRYCANLRAQMDAAEERLRESLGIAKDPWNATKQKNMVIHAKRETWIKEAAKTGKPLQALKDIWSKLYKNTQHQLLTLIEHNVVFSPQVMQDHENFLRARLAWVPYPNENTISDIMLDKIPEPQFLDRSTKAGKIIDKALFEFGIQDAVIIVSKLKGTTAGTPYSKNILFIDESFLKTADDLALKGTGALMAQSLRFYHAPTMQAITTTLNEIEPDIPTQQCNVLMGPLREIREEHEIILAALHPDYTEAVKNCFSKESKYMSTIEEISEIIKAIKPFAASKK
jgi:hypothetical protein